MQKKPKTLLFFWEKPTANQLCKLKNEFGQENILICSSNISEAEILNLVNKDFPIFENDWRHEKEQARQCYVQIMSTLPKLTYKRKKIIDELNFGKANLYWFIGHAEKSLWRSRCPHQLFAYFKLESILRDEEIEKVILISHDAVFNSLVRQNFINSKLRILSDRTEWQFSWYKYWASFFKEFYKLGYKKYYLKKYKLNGYKQLNTNSDLLFSQFPDWWSFKNEKISETFFQDVFDYQDGNITILLRINFWKDFPSRISKFTSFLRQKNVCFVENYNGLSDLAPLFFAAFKVQKYLSLLRKALRQDDTILHKFQDFVFADVKTWSETGLFPWTTLCYLAFEKINLNAFNKIYYRLEFHSHEAALIFSSHLTKKIGLQHSAIGNNFFNYQFEKNELLKNNVPLPDEFFVTGLRAKNVFLNAGIDQLRIKTIGALRLSHFYRLKKRTVQTQKNNEQLIIFMPLSQMILENLEMINMLRESENLISTKIKLLIKFNPNKINDYDYIKKIKTALGNLGKSIDTVFIHEHESTKDCYQNSDLLFVTGGSAPFEGMIFGIPSIVFSQNFSLSHNPIEEYPNAAYVVRNRFEFANAVNGHGLLENQKRFEKYWPAILNDVLGDVNAEPRQLFLK